MSKSKPKVVFGGWSLWDLNPGNYSLKSDFQENIITIGVIASALISSISDIKIVKGYEPKSISPDSTGFDKYHHSGSALDLTTESFSKEKILESRVLENFIDAQSDTNIASVVVYDDKIKVVLDNKGCVYEPTNDGHRVIYRKAFAL